MNLKHILTILFCLGFSIVSISQTKSKKELFYNPENELISKKEFNEMEGQYINRKIIESDTAIIGYQKYRIRNGHLKSNNLKNFKRLLSQTINEPIDTIKNILIHYYFNPCDVEITNEISNAKYFDTLKKFPNIKPYFITEREYRFPSDKIKVYEDKFDFLREVFRDYLYCTNYIILKPNGDYIIVYGKYKLALVLDYAI